MFNNYVPKIVLFMR